jgi:cbb3-type cytochrome oxidase maturation protein
MSISLLLIPLALVLLVVAVAAFFWAVDAGQFEDLERQGRSVLDDEPKD